MRIYNYESIDQYKIQELFSHFNNSIIVDSITPISTGMSTSNYKVNTKKATYLLKIYPNDNDHSEIEIAMYRRAGSNINIPRLLYCDNLKQVYDKTYVILEFIESRNFKEYLIENHGEFEDTVYRIGATLALLHETKYEEPGILDENLNIKKVINPILVQCKVLLDQKAGQYISDSCKEKLLSFLLRYDLALQEIDRSNVLCHGDFNFNNILIDRKDNPWVIDFEYSFSNSKYYDIGKFFRGKSKSVQPFINNKFINEFCDGYNSKTKKTLPWDWYVLSKIADIPGMLSFINRDNMPSEWTCEIEDEICSTINYVEDYYTK